MFHTKGIVMRFKDISMKFKILTIATTGIVVLAAVLSVLFTRAIGTQATEAIVEKSRAVVFTAEAARENMADKLEAGVIQDFDVLIERGDREALISAVPIITAIDVAGMNAEAANYE